MPVAEQEIGKRSLPVLSPSGRSPPPCGFPSSRSEARYARKNTIRIEFEPSDPKLAYQARLQWASVTDQVTRQSSGNTTSATNQADQGLETKKSQGKIVLEKRFVADFAADRPWHHYPPVTALTDDDRQKLVGLVTERAAAFKPNFDKLYKLSTAAPNCSSVKSARPNAWTRPTRRAYASPPRPPPTSSSPPPAAPPWW